MAFYDCPACPTDCSALTLPAADTADCLAVYNLLEGEITDIWISAVQKNATTGEKEASAPPTDWTTKAGYEGVSGLEWLEGVGDLAAPDATEATGVPKFQRLILTRTFTLTFDVTHATIANYDFMRALQCGYDVAFWYGMYGEWVFGGAEGVHATVDAAPIHERGEGNPFRMQLVLSWKAKCSPPAAELDAGGALITPPPPPQESRTNKKAA